ncbi:MAG: 2,3-bisphosphoglycerate-independent phosphoglycerate mutase [Tepidisphaera sp.]|nr:2,3-bisphosphoglycerate-independent phosphoglycerate mutase [Tepidisphaera sp.]
MLENTPVVLIIRDGWGQNPNPSHDSFNAVHLAKTPVADRLMKEYPWTLVKTSGEDVGLPDGTMGNSEVGHQNIGAGRVVPQESLVMTKACEKGLQDNAAIAGAIARCKTGSANLHLMGINSDAGVHGLLEHLFAILKACKTLGLAGNRVFVHLFSDGRDSGPFAGLAFAKSVEAKCAELGVGRVASVMGRYYAMDRDHRWERVQQAYDCLTGRNAGQGWGVAPSTPAAIQNYYDHPSGETLKGDEFITPKAIGSEAQVAASRVRDGDSVIFYNYRGDRPREISAAFVFPDDKWAKVKPSPDSGKNGFDRGAKLNLHYVTMTDYWEALTPLVSGVAFPRAAKMPKIGGATISDAGLRQFRCAETEKYPHVTFFFNDYREEPFPGETRENPPSPKVKTYDMKPEMSAEEVCQAVLRRLAAKDCEDLIVVNFANGDMVGHTGNLQAAIKACETVDGCVGRVVEATLARGGALVVFADHGNAEQMFDPTTNAPHTSHTVYDVPLIVVGEKFKGRKLRGDTNTAGWFDPSVRAGRGRLADVFPTALAMMGMKQPSEMTGKSLLV